MSTLFSCKENKNTLNHDHARELFIKSMYLAEKCIDSIENAADSATIIRILDNFNTQLTAVNYQFPPDTDLELSEEENDSLIRLFKRLDSTTRTRYKKISGNDDCDSISAETLISDSVQTKNYYILNQATPPSHN